jgi:hypothetical protein
MPRKGQDRTRLTGRLTLLFSHNAVPPPPPRANRPTFCKFMSQMPPESGFLACRPTTAHVIPKYPTKASQRSGGASEVLSGMVGRAGGVGGPRRPLKSPVVVVGARQARGGR